MSDDVEEFLEHIGVKGMKWGHRKNRSPSFRSAVRTRRQLVKSGKLTKKQVRRGNLGFARNLTIGLLVGTATGLALGKLSVKGMDVVSKNIGERFVNALFKVSK